MRVSLRAMVAAVLGASMTVVSPPTPVGADVVAVEAPAYCSVLQESGVPLTIGAIQGGWPSVDPSLVTCIGTGAGDVVWIGLTAFPTVAAAQQGLQLASTSWASPEWLQGFESAFGGGGTSRPAGSMQEQDWRLYFVRSNVVVAMQSAFVVGPDNTPLDSTSPIAVSVIASGRALDTALQDPVRFGVPTGDAPPATTTTVAPTTVAPTTVAPTTVAPTTTSLPEVFSAFGDTAFTGNELVTILNTAWLSLPETRPGFVVADDVRQSLEELIQQRSPGEVSQAQNDLLETCQLAIGLALAEPPALPGLRAMLPVIVRMTTSAVAPYDASAALAVTRLVRMTVALELQGGLSIDKPTE